MYVHIKKKESKFINILYRSMQLDCKSIKGSVCYKENLAIGQPEGKG
jgi:hypothetical protein